MLLLLSVLEQAMKTTPQEAIYGGTLLGFGQSCNGKDENGYTTIIIKPGRDIRPLSIETKEIF